MNTSALIYRDLTMRFAVTMIVTLSLALPVVLLGQAYFGTVSGELTDPSGALVQGANVVLTDQQKGFAFTTTSDSSGRSPRTTY